MRPQAFAEVSYSVFVKRSSFKSLLNLCKVYIFQEFAEGLLSISIFQNVHLSKVSAAVVPLSKSTEMWSSAVPFHHDLWYFRHRTNEHFSSMLFIRKNVTTVAPLKPLKSIHSATKLLEKLLTWAAHTFHWRLWWFPWNVWNWEV